MPPVRSALREIAICAAWLLLAGCGARSGLDVELAERDAMVATLDSGQDAGIDGGPIVLPDCFEALPAGSERGTVDEVHARVALGRDDNLYSAREIDDVWHAISIDPCLRPRWDVPLPELARSSRVDVMVAPTGEVWVIGRGEPGFVRLSPLGERLPSGFDFEGGLDTWVGVRDEGPVFSSFLSVEEKYLNVVRGGAVDTVRLASPSSFVWDGECALAGGLTACWNVAYEGTTQRWIRESPRIIDGTLRHVVPPAFDGRRLWTVRYGISSYQLVAIDAATGATDVEVGFMSTLSGQSELLIGPPVVVADGSILVYAHGTGHEGALRLHGPDGLERWRLAFPRTRRSTPAGGAIFSDEATHLVGRSGIAYLGMGDVVAAIDLESRSVLWQVAGLVDVNEPGINLARNGDLYVLDHERRLHAIATGVPGGLEATPWPIPGGNAQLSLAR